MKYKRWMRSMLVAGSLFLLAGCGSSSDMSTTENSTYYESDNLYSSDSDMVESEGVTEETQAEEATVNVKANRKLIKTVNMNVETTEYDALVSNISSRVSEMGGYIETSEVYGGGINDNSERRAYYTVRIPSDKLDAFVNQVSKQANVTRKSENVEDVTLQYVDTESKKETLEVEKERLMLLLEQADTIETIIALESRLTEIRYQLETMESQLRTYDNLVDYATIEISINEVQIYTPEEPETIWERISTGFVGSLKGVGNGLVDFVIGLIILSPYLVVWGVVITGIVLVIKKICQKVGRKKCKAKTEDKR